ncbi:MAG TPA: cytochrome P450 [Acidimicrobiia bacterium]|nr:cytochrome P450 [Acidimicrobiia bacterium]
MGFDPLTAEAESEELARLRREEPVSRAPSGPWYFARFADVLAATKDVDTFNASFREPGVVVPDEEQFINEIPEPRHGKIRRIINSAIAAHRIGRVEPYCTDLCHELLDGVLARVAAGGGPVDLVHDYVVPVPNNVIAYLLGAPPSDYRLWAEWSDEVVTGTYPTLYRNDRGEGLAGAHPEFTAYIDAAIAERRRSPRDDFMTRLLETEVDGRRLTDVEARTQLVFLFISGNETTRNLIGNLLWTVARDRALFERLRADPELIPVAVEESLRHDPPVQFLMRTCTAETEVEGQRLCPHDKVAFGIASANRDETVFDDPHSFRLDRPDPRNHLGFGGGPHVCPGATLARLEARVALGVFLDRVERVRLAPGQGYEKVPVFWARGPRELHVELEPRAVRAGA